MPKQTQTLEQNAADELAVRSVVDAIDNFCDAKDWKKCRALFAEKLDVDFTSLDGGKPAAITADELISGWKTNLYKQKKTFHQRTNFQIKINGERAESFSKAYAYNLIETGKVQGMWEIWGFYTHTLEKTAKGWKVSGMTLTSAHQRGDEKIRTYVPEKK